MSQNESHRETLNELCTRAISINRTFSGLRPLLFRTRLLALNSEIAAARVGADAVSFAVVVRDLNQMGLDLREIVTTTENLFLQIAEHVGWWIRLQARINLYRRTLDHHLELRHADDGVIAHATSSVLAIALLSNDLPELAEKQRRAFRDDSVLQTLWDQVLSQHETAINHLRDLETVAHKLIRLLEQMEFVATRQSNYLATTSMIEASRAGESFTMLGPVAESIQELARSFVELQNQAQDRVLKLSSLSGKVVRLTRR